MNLPPNYCIIVNQMFEADVFIEKFKLKKKGGFKLFPIFSDIEDKIWLLINTKKEYAKVSPIYLQNISKAKLTTKWIFFTFSFDHSIIEPEFFIIDEISNYLNGDKHYPSVVGFKNFSRRSVYSFTKLNSKFSYAQNETTFEIFNTLEKITYRELIVMTSISINDHQYSSKNQKKNLIKQNFEKISNILKNL